jgi:hypothetical protein
MTFEVCPFCKRKSHTQKQLDKCNLDFEKELGISDKA